MTKLATSLDMNAIIREPMNELQESLLKNRGKNSKHLEDTIVEAHGRMIKLLDEKPLIESQEALQRFCRRVNMILGTVSRKLTNTHPIANKAIKQWRQDMQKRIEKTVRETGLRGKDTEVSMLESNPVSLDDTDRKVLDQLWGYLYSRNIADPILVNDYSDEEFQAFFEGFEAFLRDSGSLTEDEHLEYGLRSKGQSILKKMSDDLFGKTRREPRQPQRFAKGESLGHVEGKIEIVTQPLSSEPATEKVDDPISLQAIDEAQIGMSESSIENRLALIYEELEKLSIQYQQCKNGEIEQQEHEMSMFETECRELQMAIAEKNKQLQEAIRQKGQSTEIQQNLQEPLIPLVIVAIYKQIQDSEDTPCFKILLRYAEETQSQTETGIPEDVLGQLSPKIQSAIQSQGSLGQQLLMRCIRHVWKHTSLSMTIEKAEGTIGILQGAIKGLEARLESTTHGLKRLREARDQMKETREREHEALKEKLDAISAILGI